MRTHSILSFILIAFVLSPSVVFAAGFDKGTMFSGRHSGTANAVTGSVEGSESVFFNPAGLSKSKGTEVSANFSPTFSQFQGVVVQGGAEQKSKTDFSPIFGVFASHALTESFAFGLGVYAAGGTAANYESVDLTPVNASFTSFKPTVKSSLSLIEFSPGIGYSLTPNFHFGAAWRLVAAQGEFSTVNFSSGMAIASQVKDLKKTRYNGFRVGAQWNTDDRNTGLGVSWRTPVKFNLDGTSSVQFSSSATGYTVVNGTGGPATVTTTFPSQIALGGYHVVESWNMRVLLDYSWTNYMANRDLELSGSITLGSTTLNLDNIAFHWRNQHLAKLGFETADWQDWAWRGGIAYVSQVVPNDHAGATLVAPGGGFSVHGGLGKYLSEKTLEVNGSLEYDLIKGTGQSGVPTNTASGNYTTISYAIHTGVTWHL